MNKVPDKHPAAAALETIAHDADTVGCERHMAIGPDPRIQAYFYDLAFVVFAYVISNKESRGDCSEPVCKYVMPTFLHFGF